jgi:glycosyltransferase involved in cell wall biosynthesis
MLQLIEGLDRSRYEPSVVLLRSTGKGACGVFPCPVEILGVERLASLGAVRSLVRCAGRLGANGVRLVHCFFNDASVVAPIFRLFGMRILVSRRDMGFWYTPLVLAALRLGSPFVDRYVANSEAVRELVSRRERVARDRISVIYNGYRGRCVSALPGEVPPQLADIPDGAPIVGLVANLRPIKRIDTLIEAFARIRTDCPDAWLVIVGSDGPDPTGGSLMESLSALASRLGIGHRVMFTGQVNNAAPCIDRFSVAVLCSDSEGFSNAIIEYMQAGRPTVCTCVGGNPELIQDGYNGFLVPVGDAEALAGRVIELLSDEGLARRLGTAALESVRTTYSDVRMIGEQMACYDRILNRSTPIRRLQLSRGQN